MLRVATVLVVFLGACTSTTPPPQPTKVEAKQTPPRNVDTDGPDSTPEPRQPPMPDQWTCSKDADCAQTCALGAVSRAWLERNRDADPCDDGCGWKSGQQACRDGECVTLTADGDIDEACTKRPVPPAR